MKRSRKIDLLVLGTAALMAGCSGATSDSDIQQKHYASQADCERDWGRTADSKSACSKSGSGFLGPRYYWNHASGRPVALMPDGTHRPMSAEALSRSTLATSKPASHASSHSSGVSRGGFGGFGRGSAGG